VKRPRVAKGPRVQHDVFLVDIRGDGLCELRYDTKLNILSAHRNLPSHGRQCRVNRTLNASTHRSRAAQGRPAGFLLAWLKCAAEHGSQAEHHKIASDRRTVVPSLSFTARSEARARAKARYPDLAAFLEVHEAEKAAATDPDEPADLC
jgi:hypothetical protein